jgi:hypothetical protein
MSLINDALKRTKEAQQQAARSASPGAHLRPLVAAPSPARGPGRVWPGVLGVAGLLALFLIWQAIRSPGPAPVVAAAPARPEPSPAGRSSTTGPGLEGASPVSLPASQPAPGSGAPEADPATNQPAVEIVSACGPAPAAPSPAAAAPETPVPGPPPLKLQAIVFHPTRPWAMISGKTLFVGDRLGEMELVAVGREGATLVGAGQTNVLNLPY